MNHISFHNVNMNDGFWKQKQDMNRKITIYSVWERFKETGRFDAFKFDWKEGMPHKPDIFWDSDVAKWMEGAAYILQKEPDENLKSALEELIDLIEKHQDENGYFNIHFTVCEPQSRFQRRTDHELYCAGHLIEAAVAYYDAVNDDRFLKLMCKYADHIEKVFVKDNSSDFATPGHQEIELALIRLYHCTKEKRYLELSKFFVDQRGANDRDVGKEYSFANPHYSQSHLPVREQTTAEGHCVRGCYLYCAMADLAYEYKDKELANACEKIFSNIIEKRMYITGGIGQSHLGEAFTIDYDLPNKTAYAETCAAISLAMLARRMLNIKTSSVYSDIIERVLYNGMLSGISLDGKSFFYENPLEIDPKLKDKDISLQLNTRMRFPATQRAEVFECSCCPPNLNRFFASIGDFIYSLDNDTYFVNQFIASTMKKENSEITQYTSYPNDGKVIIKTVNVNKLAIRIPDWCDEYSINAEFIIKDGYAHIQNVQGDIEVNFVIKPQLIQSSPYVQENAGRAALQMGPLIYCLEEVDNGKDLRNIYVDKSLNPSIQYDNYFGANTIIADGYRPLNTSKLYSPWNEKTEKAELKFIPYYAFANRGESEMIVWVNVK